MADVNLLKPRWQHMFPHSLYHLRQPSSVCDWKCRCDVERIMTKSVKWTDLSTIGFGAALHGVISLACMEGSAFVLCEVAVLERHPGHLGRLISTLKKTNSDLLTYFKMLNSVKAHSSAQNQPFSGSLCMINGALLLMACVWEFSDLAENVTALG